MANPKYDFLIVGSGIMGLSIALKLSQKNPHSRILIIDKEPHVAAHASSRNSGVLHAGFYYSADSLKAKLTVTGNRAMKEYCRSKNIAVNACGKLVVAQNEEELNKLHELEQRGKRNGSNVSLLDERAAEAIEPNVRTFKKALYSPDTASINPAQVCLSLKQDLTAKGVEIRLGAKFLKHKGSII